MVDEQHLSRLRSCLIDLMPLLSNNLAAANDEYMSGKIPHGAFQHILNRYTNAGIVIEKEDIDPLDAFNVCAFLCHDLKYIVREAKDKKYAKKLSNSWWECYKEAGFTDIHPLWKSPCLPKLPDVAEIT